MIPLRKKATAAGSSMQASLVQTMLISGTRDNYLVPNDDMAIKNRIPKEIVKVVFQEEKQVL